MTAAADRPQLKELFDIVDSVKGIGPVIATEVLITINEFKDISDPKKYACYSGFAPFEHSSGKYKGKSKVSNKANKKSDRRCGQGFVP